MLQKMRQWGSSHRSRNLVKSMAMRHLAQATDISVTAFEMEQASSKIKLLKVPGVDMTKQNEEDDEDYYKPQKPKERFFKRLVKASWQRLYFQSNKDIATGFDYLHNVHKLRRFGIHDAAIANEQFFKHILMTQITQQAFVLKSFAISDSLAKQL